MPYVPSRGDIVHLQFDPSAGREVKGPHFGLVLSGKVFNQQGLAMICPISQGSAAGARTYGTVVTLIGSGIDTQGAVHCHQLKALDWRTHNIRHKEKAPAVVMDEVMARVEAILFE
ncbi:type II toxin-antitoxin system PemK/MazF family toxin [Alcaligenaceae bacterium]|nr:type II toxin-antitoxin system PemK/MazF family toxin [Alcaligenaceae bacterium]